METNDFIFYEPSAFCSHILHQTEQIALLTFIVKSDFHLSSLLVAELQTQRLRNLVTDGLSQEDRHILLSVAVKKTKLFTVSTDARRDLLVPAGHKVRVPGRREEGGWFQQSAGSRDICPPRCIPCSL